MSVNQQSTSAALFHTNTGTHSIETTMLSNKHVEEFPKPFKYTPYIKYSFKCNAKGSFEPCNLNVCKIIILGDLCVGKTSILNRFCHRIFDSNYRSTIGVDFQTEKIDIQNVPYHLQIWDTAGQERFKCIAQCYYRKAHVIMLVFDLSAIRTLANCKTWLKDALEMCDDPGFPYVFLVGSKKDLLSTEGCKSAENLAEDVAKNLKAEFWSVSSKTGENVDNLFFRAAALAFDYDCLAATKKVQERVQIGNERFKKSNVFRTTASNVTVLVV